VHGGILDREGEALLLSPEIGAGSVLLCLARRAVDYRTSLDFSSLAPDAQVFQGLPLGLTFLDFLLLVDFFATMLSPSPELCSSDSAIDGGSPPRDDSSTSRWRLAPPR